MRILLVNKFHYIKGGSETYYFSLAEGLRSLGHEVFFFSMKDERNVPCSEEEYFVSNIDYNDDGLIKKIRAGLTLVYSSEAKEKFEAVLQKVRPDVVHLNLVHRQITLSVLDAPSLKGIPVVFTSHDYILICPCYTMVNGSNEVCDECLGGKFSSCVRNECVKKSRTKSFLAFLEAAYLKKHKSYQRIDRIIAPSRFMEAKLLEAGFPSKQVVYMQNFINARICEEAKKATAPRLPSRNILYFGRLSAEKGLSTLLQAFSRTIESIGGDWKLVIAGTGPFLPEMKGLVEDLDISKSVMIVGYKTGNELAELIEGACFTVLPSEWRENMPYSIIESFAKGTPAIGNSIGGIPELIKDGETGFLAEAGSVDSLVRALLRAVDLSADEEAYAAMRKRCRSYVVEHCDPNEYVKSLVDLYEQLVGDKKVGTCGGRRERE